MDPPNEQRREPRYPFVASIDLLEAQSETRASTRTCDLSLHGCYVDTMNPFPVGSKVHITITHADTTFTADGAVAHSQPNIGMGISFTALKPDQERVLIKWLADVHGD